MPDQQQYTLIKQSGPDGFSISQGVDFEGRSDGREPLPIPISTSTVGADSTLLNSLSNAVTFFGISSRIPFYTRQPAYLVEFSPNLTQIVNSVTNENNQRAQEASNNSPNPFQRGQNSVQNSLGIGLNTQPGDTVIQRIGNTPLERAASEEAQRSALAGSGAEQISSPEEVVQTTSNFQGGSGGGKIWQFLYNPSTLRFNQRVNYATSDTYGTQGSSKQWLRNDNETLTLSNITLNGYGLGKHVQSLIEGLRELLSTVSGSDPLELPTVYNFIWGKKIFGPCIITSVNWTEMMQDADSNCVRAEVNIELMRIPLYDVNIGRDASTLVNTALAEELNNPVSQELSSDTSSQSATATSTQELTDEDIGGFDSPDTEDRDEVDAFNNGTQADLNQRRKLRDRYCNSGDFSSCARQRQLVSLIRAGMRDRDIVIDE